MEGMGSRPSDSFQISSHSRFQHSHSVEPRRGCLVQGESTLAMQHEPILDSPAASDQGRMPFLAVPTHASDLGRHPITSGHTSSVTSSLPSLHAAVEVLCSRGCQAPASFVALAVGLHADTNSAPCSALQILKFSSSRTPHVCVSCSPRCAGGPSLWASSGWWQPILGPIPAGLPIPDGVFLAGLPIPDGTFLQPLVYPSSFVCCHQIRHADELANTLPRCAWLSRSSVTPPNSTCSMQAPILISGVFARSVLSCLRCSLQAPTSIVGGPPHLQFSLVAPSCLCADGATLRPPLVSPRMGRRGLVVSTPEG